ncbi:MAG: transcription termination factor NusA [bacterium]|nr:transcription termination factor NusA [bacterium]
MKAELQEALAQIEKDKGIKKEVLIQATKDALTSAYKKSFGSTHNIEVEFDNKKGFYLVFNKDVVETVKNSHTQISLSDAKAIDSKVEIGDKVKIESFLEDFGRIAAQTAKQVITQRIREAEKNLIYEEFKERTGEVITGIIQRTGKNQNVLIQLGKTEAVLPLKEQIFNEKYKVGDRIKCYILNAVIGNRGPEIILSRTYPELVKRLFEMEVPEIYENIVSIKSVSRVPGHRAKIAVASVDPNVDAVGACVGMKGMRVQAVIKELNGEKIDVVGYSEDPAVFIENSLSPSKVDEVIVDKETKTSLVIVPDDQLSLAIGKEGQNVRLAAKLTGWRIDIKSKSQVAKEKEAELLKKAEEELDRKKEEGTGDIKELAGVGPKLESKLKDAGFKTIEDIAKATIEELTAIPLLGKVKAEKLLKEAKNL